MPTLFCSLGRAARLQASFAPSVHRRRPGSWLVASYGFLLIGDRQHNGECRSFTNLALNVHSSEMTIDNGLARVQTQPHATFFGCMQAIKNMPQLFRRNAIAGICDRNDRVAAIVT